MHSELDVGAFKTLFVNAEESLKLPESWEGGGRALPGSHSPVRALWRFTENQSAMASQEENTRD